MGWRPSSVLLRLLCVAVVSLFVIGSVWVWPTVSHAETLREHGIVDYFSSGGSSGAAAKPKVKEHPPVEMVSWQGLQIPKTGSWDFFGLEVEDRPVELDMKLLKADYDVNAVDGSKVPPGYESVDDPAYVYPEPNDRLYRTVSTIPRILYFPRIATDEETDLIIKQASPGLRRSQVALTERSRKEKQSSTQEVRTSKSTWVTLNGQLSNLEKRLSAIVGVSWHEPMNVLLYGPNQHYDAHHDYFDPAMYGAQGNNRMGTFFVYLADTEAGGATTVPRANKGKHPINYKAASCNQGLQVFPKKGSAILLYDMRPDRSLDVYSLHGGCDVVNGTKWGGVVWFRAKTPPGYGKAHE